MDGILIIDKPDGWTSHDVVARLRRILQTKRIGHTGTLDPFATGVLVMLVGKATRLAQYLDKDAKEYEARVRLGYETDTGDRTGERRESKVQGPKSKVGEITIEDVEGVLPRFRGEIGQVPPMYSAKKVAGKKLYELARKGVEIERKAIIVNIAELEVFELSPKSKIQGPKPEEGPDIEHGTLDIGLRVTCSAGTYIRTLAEDIGRAAGTGAHLAELRRTRAGRFGLERAATLEKLEEMDDPAACLLPMNEAVRHLPGRELNQEEMVKIRKGMKIPARIEETGVQIVRLTAAGGELIAMGFHDENEGVVRPRLVF